MQRHKTRAQQDPEHEQPEEETEEPEQPAPTEEPKEDVHEEAPPPTDEDPLANPAHKEGLSTLGTPKKPAAPGTKAESD